MNAIRILVVMVIIAIAACAGPQRQGGPPEIGRLDVDGPNAFRNGVRADDGARVLDGDTVTTGAATSVKIVFRDGGYVQLDQNTDPEFRLFREGGCILVKMLTGQTFIDAKRVCISDPNIELALNSRVNLRSGTRSDLTVIEGSADVTRPARVRVQEYYQYNVTSGRAEAPPYYIGREQAEESANWTRRYFRRTGRAFPPSRQGWEPSPPTPRPTTPRPRTSIPSPDIRIPTPPRPYRIYPSPRTIPRPTPPPPVP